MQQPWGGEGKIGVFYKGRGLTSITKDLYFNCSIKMLFWMQLSTNSLDQGSALYSPQIRCGPGHGLVCVRAKKLHWVQGAKLFFAVPLLFPPLPLSFSPRLWHGYSFKLKGCSADDGAGVIPLPLLCTHSLPPSPSPSQWETAVAWVQFLPVQL